MHDSLHTGLGAVAQRPQETIHHALAGCNWNAPWLADYAQPFGLALQAALATGKGMAHALSQVASQLGAATEDELQTTVVDGVRGRFPAFVPQACLPKGLSYESFIRQHWAVPTREHLHDLFNGLIWLHWPHTKKQLNALQSAEIERLGVQGPRGVLRDACTLFDENGAVLLAPAALHQALLARDWLRLFWTERALWEGARLLIVGHALLEQLCQPRKALCAHVLTLPIPMPDEPLGASLDLARLDQCLAGVLSAEALRRKPLTPLPVLGIPGWTRDNEQRSFYEDTGVFRPPRPRLD